MSQPPTPPADGPAASFPQPHASGAPTPPSAGAGADAQWNAPPAPSWAAPWEAPAAPVWTGQQITGIPAAEPGRSGRWPALVLVAVVAAVAGAVAAGFLVTAVFLAGVKDIGAEIGSRVEDGVSEGIRDGMAQSMEDAMSFGDQGSYTEEMDPMPPAEQFPAVEPGDLGPDPDLNAYAGSCFAGELQACDDLFYEAPPLSGYEEYGSTCGGRVKAYAAMSCTELE